MSTTERDRIYRAIRDAIVEHTPWDVHMEDIEQVAAIAAARLEGEEVDDGVRCTCEWAHPVQGHVGLYPAELDPHCEVHGAPAGWPDMAEWCAEYHGDHPSSTEEVEDQPTNAFGTPPLGQLKVSGAYSLPDAAPTEVEKAFREGFRLSRQYEGRDETAAWLNSAAHRLRTTRTEGVEVGEEIKDRSVSRNSYAGWTHGREEYYCGCVRKAQWSRCDRHKGLDHDEEPPAQRDRPDPSTYSSEDIEEAFHRGYEAGFHECERLRTTRTEEDLPPEQMAEALVYAADHIAAGDPIPDELRPAILAALDEEGGDG